MDRYRPGESDNQILYDLYQRREDLESDARLADDLWKTISISVQSWIDSLHFGDMREEVTGQALADVLARGEELYQRATEASNHSRDVAATYRKWTTTLTSLPLNPEGDPQDLARHWLDVGDAIKAKEHYQRIDVSGSHRGLLLALEVLARNRCKEDYCALFEEHRSRLGVVKPHFDRLNVFLRSFSSGMAWISASVGAGTAFGS